MGGLDLIGPGPLALERRYGAAVGAQVQAVLSIV